MKTKTEKRHLIREKMTKTSLLGVILKFEKSRKRENLTLVLNYLFARTWVKLPNAYKEIYRKKLIERNLLKISTRENVPLGRLCEKLIEMLLVANISQPLKSKVGMYHENEVFKKLLLRLYGVKEVTYPELSYFVKRKDRPDIRIAFVHFLDRRGYLANNFREPRNLFNESNFGAAYSAYSDEFIENACHRYLELIDSVEFIKDRSGCSLNIKHRKDEIIIPLRDGRITIVFEALFQMTKTPQNYGGVNFLAKETLLLNCQRLEKGRDFKMFKNSISFNKDLSTILKRVNDYILQNSKVGYPVFSAKDKYAVVIKARDILM